MAMPTCDVLTQGDVLTNNTGTFWQKQTGTFWPVTQRW